MSAEANASESSCPARIPAKWVLLPTKSTSSFSRMGPSPTRARRHLGKRSRSGLKNWRFFSAPNLPTQMNSGFLGCPLVKVYPMADNLNVVSNTAVSIGLPAGSRSGPVLHIIGEGSQGEVCTVMLHSLHSPYEAFAKAKPIIPGIYGHVRLITQQQ